MLVLHEGLIPSSNLKDKYKVVLLNSNTDINTFNNIFNKGLELLKYNPNSLPFITKYSDKTTAYRFLLEVTKGNIPEYGIIVVFKSDDLNPVGASLVSWGRPWYAPTGILVINEECTVALKRGVGIARILSFVLEKYASENKDFKLVMFSNANLPNRKMLENTYEKHLGYSSYKTFYKEVNT